MLFGCSFFFFKQKTAYEMRIRDWSSDVCSSDLPVLLPRRIDRDRADHHQRPGAAVVARKRHRPALDRPEERAILDEREAQRRDRRRAVAHLIGGSRVPIGAERTVEQLLHGGVVDLGQRRETWGRELRHRAYPPGDRKSTRLNSSH